MSPVQPPFVPQDWYWLSIDGRVYASGRRVAVTETDSQFVAWKTAGGIPTAWPKDDAGTQSNAALQDVLTPYGITM